MFIRYVLKNGLRVICEKIPYVRSVSVGVWSGAGSRLEVVNNNGISHFAEHMLFKGTKTRTAQMIAEEMDFIGGHLNAFTSRECTCYYAKVIDSHLEKALDILSDMYLNPSMSDDDIELERRVILEEISMYEDSPEDVALELLTSTVWEGDSMGFSVSGTPESVSGITHEQLRAFTEKYYTAQNTVLAVAGNFDEKHLFSLIEKYFGALPSGDGEYTKYTDVDFYKKKVSREKDIEQTHLFIGYPGVPHGSDDFYAEAVLSNILGGGMSSRLFQNIREARGLAYSVYSAPEGYRGAGILYIYAGLSPENLGLVSELIFSEVESLKKEGAGKYELARGREQLRGSYIMSLESVSARMNAIGRAELLSGRPKTPDEVIEKIVAVDGDAVEKIINKVFGSGYAESAVSAKQK